MPYDSRTVANYFLTLGQQDNVPIFPLQMQKLLYLANGWNLALRGEPLIRDRIEAWRYGPVVPPVYQAFKRFGSSAITEPAAAPNEHLDDDSIELIQTVWNRYRPYSGTQLAAMTHERGYAWDLTRKKPLALFGASPVIKTALIADEFQRRRNLQEIGAPAYE